VAKYSQYAVYLHKHFWAKARDNAAWSATRIVHQMCCLYRVTSLSTWRQRGAAVCACVKAQGGHFEHKLSQ